MEGLEALAQLGDRRIKDEASSWTELNVVLHLRLSVSLWLSETQSHTTILVLPFFITSHTYITYLPLESSSGHVTQRDGHGELSTYTLLKAVG